LDEERKPSSVEAGTVARRITAQYLSPEQARGEPVVQVVARRWHSNFSSL